MRLFSNLRCASVAGLLIAPTALAWAGPVKQTDWSGGGGTLGPELRWTTQFAEQDGTSWRAIPGQVALAGTQRVDPVRTLVADNADLPRGVAVGDFDDDGRSDFAAGDPVTDPFNPIGAIRWWHAEVNGTYTEHYVSDTFYGSNYLTTADVDRDGDLDLLVAAYYGVIEPPPPPPEARNGRYAWFENVHGDGSQWQEHIVGELFWGGEFIDAGDFDGDGDIDLVGASYLTRGIYEQESDITWFENFDGQGTDWRMHEVAGQYDNGYEAHFADLDGDDDLDILATHSGRISWWENTTGTGDVLVEHILTTSLMNVGYVDAGDIDNDGDLDVIGSTYSTSVLLWWENLNGQGTAWIQHTIGPNPNGEEVILADLDGDGDLDALADRAFSLDGLLIVWMNTSGTGSAWSGRTVSYEQYTDYSVAVGDADNDGDLDAVVASEDIRRSLGFQVSYFDIASFDISGGLLSSILDGGVAPGWGSIAWDSSVPKGATLDVEVRASDDPGDLGPFVRVPDSGSDLSSLIDADARYLQYRLALTGGGDVSPVLRELTIERAGNGIGLVLSSARKGVGGQPFELTAESEQIGARVVFAAALSQGITPIPPCPGVSAGLAEPRLAGSARVEAHGIARLVVTLPGAAAGRTLFFQVLEVNDCVVSNVVAVLIR